ncbi:MAG: L-dopachrome tautomerase-related protein [Alphaproteobacteria bacterium]|nr:L-dopachrome tautomerase-related protein [Alphaproteobacteria bacterium]
MTIRRTAITLAGLALFLSAAGVLRAEGLEVVARFEPANPPGNIAVTPDGRLIMSLHPFYVPAHRVVEVLKDGTTKPFPNAVWSGKPGANGVGLNGVLGLRSDGRGIVWMLDTAGEGQSGKLVAWDTRSDRLHRVIYLPPPATLPESFLNDLAVDLVNNAIYIADTAPGKKGALIVVDLTTGLAVRRLQGHVSVVPEDIPMVIDGRTVTLGGEEARISVDSITVDPSNQWVYFGPMSGTSLYRIRTADLLNLSLSDTQLGNRVERYGDKPISDGITADGAGNIYITDITNNAIGVTGADGRYQILYQHPERLSWPDGMAFDAFHRIYVTVNQLHRSAPLNRGKDISKPPFHLVRFPALAPGSVGR